MIGNMRLLAIGLVSIAAFFADLAAAQTETNTNSLARGRELYVTRGCYQCHGYVGQGAPATGPALTPFRLSDADATRLVRTPRGVMPPYSANILPQDSLADILAYIRSLQPGRQASDIPLLSGYVAQANRGAPAMRTASRGAPSGRELYDAHCSVCHGVNRQGGTGPALAGPQGRRTETQVSNAIIMPPPGMPRLYPAQLSSEQVAAIAEYVANTN